jgi:hypothetical protein
MCILIRIGSVAHRGPHPFIQCGQEESGEEDASAVSRSDSIQQAGTGADAGRQPRIIHHPDQPSFLSMQGIMAINALKYYRFH